MPQSRKSVKELFDIFGELLDGMPTSLELRVSVKTVSHFRHFSRQLSHFVNNLFRLGRHLLKAKNYWTFRDRAFNEWARVSCAQYLA